MKVAAVRIVADALRGLLTGVQGVNTCLGVVPRDGADEQPSNVTVYDETTDPDAALGTLPESPKRPAVLVSLLDLVDGMRDSVETPTRQYSITIGIRVVRTDAETTRGLAALYYTEDAILESLRQLHANARITERTRSGVCLHWARRVASKAAVTPAQDEIVTGMIVVEYDAVYTP